MKLSMQLTLDGMVKALRWKAGDFATANSAKHSLDRRLSADRPARVTRRAKLAQGGSTHNDRGIG